jgi:small subunit ribosomal protein S17
MMAKLPKRKTIKVGVVVGKKMKKTVTVLVERQLRHPFYKKIIKRKTSFLAHDEYDKCKIGDIVRIAETRPISRRKKWRVMEIVGLSSTEVETEPGEMKE